MENQSGEQIAMANVFVYLDDLGINCNSKLKKYANLKSLPPRPYLDENLAYKIVEELEEWKLKQQELFLIEVIHCVFYLLLRNYFNLIFSSCS